MRMTVLAALLAFTAASARADEHRPRVGTPTLGTNVNPDAPEETFDNNTRPPGDPVPGGVVPGGTGPAPVGAPRNRRNFAYAPPVGSGVQAAEDDKKKAEDDKPPTDDRAVKGAVMGALAGALIGALIGFALGGPFGAIGGAIIGAGVGIFAGAALAKKWS